MILLTQRWIKVFLCSAKGFVKLFFLGIIQIFKNLFLKKKGRFKLRGPRQTWRKFELVVINNNFSSHYTWKTIFWIWELLQPSKYHLQISPVTLPNYIPILLFYTPWKHQKTFRFTDVFREYRNATPSCNGLSKFKQINYDFLTISWGIGVNSIKPLLSPVH